MKLNLFVMSLCSSQWTALVLPQSDPQVHARGGFYLHRILQRKYVRYTLYNLSLLSRGRRLCLFCLVFELNTAWSLSPSPLTASDAGWNINTVVRAEWIHSLCLTAVCAFSIDTWQSFCSSRRRPTLPLLVHTAVLIQWLTSLSISASFFLPLNVSHF